MIFWSKSRIPFLAKEMKVGNKNKVCNDVVFGKRGDLPVRRGTKMMKELKKWTEKVYN